LAIGLWIERGWTLDWEGLDIGLDIGLEGGWTLD
jgi:hypothetical protein